MGRMRLNFHSMKTETVATFMIIKSSVLTLSVCYFVEHFYVFLKLKESVFKEFQTMKKYGKLKY